MIAARCPSCFRRLAPASLHVCPAPTPPAAPPPARRAAKTERACGECGARFEASPRARPDSTCGARPCRLARQRVRQARFRASR